MNTSSLNVIGLLTKSMLHVIVLQSSLILHPLPRVGVTPEQEEPLPKSAKKQNMLIKIPLKVALENISVKAESSFKIGVKTSSLCWFLRKKFTMIDKVQQNATRCLWTTKEQKWSVRFNVFRGRQSQRLGRLTRRTTRLTGLPCRRASFSYISLQKAVKFLHTRPIVFACK